MALIETLAPVIEFFLLSIEEAEHYFPNAEARRVKLIDNEFENLKCFFSVVVKILGISCLQSSWGKQGRKNSC